MLEFLFLAAGARLLQRRDRCLVEPLDLGDDERADRESTFVCEDQAKVSRIAALMRVAGTGATGNVCDRTSPPHDRLAPSRFERTGILSGAVQLSNTRMPQEDKAMTSSPSTERPGPTRLAKVARAALVWFLVALVFVFQNAVVNAVRGDPFQWLPVVGFELEYWFVFFLATPLFLWSVRRFRFEPGTLLRSVAAHSGIGVTFAAVQPVLADGLNYLTLRAVAAPNDPRIAHIVESSLHTYSYFVVTALWKYAVVIGCSSAFYYYQRSRDHQWRTIQLEAQLASAHLQTLRMQLHPHFLFNTLNSAAMLTITEPQRAHGLLVQLAELLRATLHSEAPQEVHLVAELEFLDRYLAIERARFEGRLITSFAIAEDTEELLVPSMILQPLVENAIRHGMHGDGDVHTIVVTAMRTPEELILEVLDDGVGVPSDWTFETHAGFGLTNVQRRVSATHGAPHPMDFSRLDSGFAVRLTLPIRMSSESR